MRVRRRLLPALSLVAALAACGEDYARELEKAEQAVQRGQYEKAFERFDRLRRRFPDEHRPYVRMAWLAVRRGRPADALPALEERVARGGPGADRAHDLLGGLLERLDRLEEAEVQYRAALTLRADQPTTVLKLSRVLARRGRYAEALEAAAGGIERSPEDVQLRSWYGEMLVKRRRWDEAETLLRETLELPGPGAARAYPHYVLGLVYLHTGRPEEARRELETSVELQPRVEEVWYQLANVCDRLGDGPARDRALERFAELYRPRVTS